MKSLSQCRNFVAITAIAAMGFVLGCNATTITSAIYVSKVTGTPFLRVLAPLERNWLGVAYESLKVPQIDAEDEN